MSERATLAYLYWPIAGLVLYTLASIEGMLTWLGVLS